MLPVPGLNGSGTTAVRSLWADLCQGEFLTGLECSWSRKECVFTVPCLKPPACRMGEEQLSCLVGGTGSRGRALKCYSPWKPKRLSPGFREVPVAVLDSKIVLF